MRGNSANGRSCVARASDQRGVVDEAEHKAPSSEKVRGGLGASWEACDGERRGREGDLRE
jgi:hypothetical protein